MTKQLIAKKIAHDRLDQINIIQAVSLAVDQQQQFLEQRREDA